MIKEKYEKLKSENVDSLILIKSGNFYVTFNDDAQIMNLLFKYKIVKNRVGFPLNIIDKIIVDLKIGELNYIIFNSEDDIKTKKFKKNAYNEVLRESKKVDYRNSRKKLLFDRIEFLIDTDSKNYEKISTFIDKL